MKIKFFTFCNEREKNCLFNFFYLIILTEIFDKPLMFIYWLFVCRAIKWTKKAGAKFFRSSASPVWGPACLSVCMSTSQPLSLNCPNILGNYAGIKVKEDDDGIAFPVTHRQSEKMIPHWKKCQPDFCPHC